jgi:hypothetical protein
VTDADPERMIADLIAIFTDPDTPSGPTLYQLLAPRMRAGIGSLADLERTLSNTLFAPLVGGARIEILDSANLGSAARVHILVTDGAGQRAPFLFSLARRGRESSGGWEITGLVREDAL